MSYDPRIEADPTSGGSRLESITLVRSASAVEAAAGKARSWEGHVIKALTHEQRPTWQGVRELNPPARVLETRPSP